MLVGGMVCFDQICWIIGYCWWQEWWLPKRTSFQLGNCYFCITRSESVFKSTKFAVCRNLLYFANVMLDRGTSLKEFLMFERLDICPNANPSQRLRNELFVSFNKSIETWTKVTISRLRQVADDRILDDEVSTPVWFQILQLAIGSCMTFPQCSFVRFLPSNGKFHNWKQRLRRPRRAVWHALN